MNKKEIKKAIESILQYGGMWGHPIHIAREDWDNIRKYYKEELNGGKEFEPDRTRKANFYES